MTDLFAIHCTTCKTRLRVRDLAAIGQILACPKCSSMVLVEPPAGWSSPIETAAVPPLAGTVARNPAPEFDPRSMKETASASHFADVEALFGEGQTGGSSKAAAIPAHAKPGDVPRPEEQLLKSLKRRHSPPPQPPPAEIAADTPTSKSDVVPLDWTPPHARRLRSLVMLGLGSCIGIGLAVGAGYFAANAARGKPVAEAVIDLPSIEEPPRAAEQALDPVPEPPLPEQTPEPGSPAPTPQIEKAESEPATKHDPLKILDPPPIAQSGNDPLNLAELRNQFSQLPGDENAPGEPDSVSSDSATADPTTPHVVPVTEPSARPRPEPKQVDVAERLADRLVEIEFPGVPLTDVLQFLSDYSTIPITLDPDAVLWSKTTPAVRSNVKLSNATVEEVLAAVLKPLRLETVKLPDQILITRSPKLKSIKCPVEDLTGGNAAQEKELVEMIEALAAPESWKRAGGAGAIVPGGDELTIENTEMAFGEVLQVCERLRLARGLRPRSAFPEQIFNLTHRTRRAAERLGQPLSLNFSQPQPLVKILSRISEESSMMIVVDWQSLSEIGWPPNADATVTLESTPLGEGLTKLLTPMDLTYRVVDANVLQITTPQAIRKRPEIEVHAVADLAANSDQGAALVERISKELGGDPALRYDAVSKTLFALLPQPEQAKLAALLDSLRPEDADSK